MSDLINREEAIRAVCDEIEEERINIIRILEKIAELPSVLFDGDITEVVVFGDKFEKVVRCKDCRHWNSKTKGCKRNLSVEEWNETDYCSYHSTSGVTISTLKAPKKYPQTDLIRRADALEEMAQAECGLHYADCEADNCFCAYIKRILNIPSAEAEWIPITTSKPNTADHVLVTYKWGDDDLEVSELDYWVTKGEADDGNASCKRLIDHVIAWRPMLKPYIDESEVEE